MITNADITIFHKGYDPATRLNTWGSKYFANVSMQNDTKVNVLGDGLKSANIVKVRIPTTENIDIANGDKVVLGNASVLSEKAYTVIGFADNRKGSPNMHHWKVICS